MALLLGCQEQPGIAPPAPATQRSALTTAFLSPTANAAVTASAGDNNGFETNPTGPYATGGTSAVSTNSGANNNVTCASTGADKHDFFTYAITPEVAAGSKIDGLEIRADFAVDSTAAGPFVCVALSYDGGTNWTAWKQLSLTGTALTPYTFGGSADDWGRPWTLAELSDANFRVRVVTGDTNTSQSARDFSLDWLPLKVHSTPPGVTVSAVSGNTTEAGGTATLTVVLDTPPSANVTIAVSSSDTSEGTVSPASLTFTSGDWNTPQTVTATGVNDFVDDGDIGYTIVLGAAASADANYNGMAVADGALSNVDDDTAGITVSAVSGNTTEAGGTATLTVVLDSEPTANVTIAASSSDTAEGTVSPASLTFTSGNWSTPQTVTATGVNDFIDDGDIGYTIILGAAVSADGNYSGVNPADGALSNIDDDVAGISVSAVSGNTTEAGGTATLTVALDSEPTANVTIAVFSSDTSEGTVSPASLIFTSANWSTPQTVTASGVDEFIDDGDVGYTIVLGAAVSADGNYGGVNPADGALSNVDNDTAGITVSAVSGNTTEAGGTATLTVALDSEPTANVTVAVSSSNTAEGTVSPASLTFTSGNWGTPQTVTATGADELIDDGDVSYNIVLGAAVSGDGTYNGIDPLDRSLSNVDDDSAGITVSAVSGNTSEAGGTATLTVVLASQPTANVTIGVSSSNTAEGTVSPASLTFTAGDWSTPQTVTATGANDSVDDGDISYDIVLGAAVSADGAFSGIDPLDRSLSNVDDDIAGITVSAISGNTTESGGTATLTVVLDSQPTADVTMAVSSSNIAEGTVSPASLTFTSANWSTPQTVTATGVDDGDFDGDISYAVVLGAASSADASYNGTNPPDRTLSNLDNDVPGITVSAVSGNTTEAGGTATLTVVLDTLPSADVTIAVSSSNTAEGTVSPASLTFTAGNWSTPQTVTATGVDDLVDDGDIAYNIVLGAAVSADPGYNGLDPADRTPFNIDDDSAGITVSAVSGNTTEAGGTATLTVVLTSQPTANVGIAVSSSNTAEGTVSPAGLTFTAGNWSTPQTVTATGADDLVDDGDIVYSIVLDPAVSADADYSGLDPADRTTTNIDNETASISVSAVSGNTSESGGTATVIVVLASQPTADVTVAVSSSNTNEGTVSPASLTFTSVNWATPQTVTATGVDDFLDDGDVVYSIVLGAAVSADGLYNGIDPSDRTPTNLDDDTAGISVSAVSGDTTEGGGTATLTVVLDSQPTANVTIAVSSSNVAEGTVSPASLTFTSANWSAPQTVTATGVNDALTDGTISYTIVLDAAVSADGNYGGMNPPDRSLSNIDDDSPGITVSAVSGDTTEAGGTATLTVVLNTLPSADVSIAVSSSNTAEGTVSPATLTFTMANWSTPQTVTATGVDDLLIDGNIGYSIVLAAATSTDGNYDGLDPADRALSNTDDDVAGISVSAVSGDTTEAGGTATLTVVLTTQPTATVTIPVSSSDTSEGTVSPTSLVFTTANWNTPKTVTATGVNDVSVDGNVGYTVVLGAATSVDSDYSGLDPADQGLWNLDDDSAGFTVSAISGNTSESGGTAIFTVLLTSQPTANVSVAVSSSNLGEGTVSPASLVFSAANWNAPQTVTATGVNDQVVDGNVAYSIILAAAASADLNYLGVDPADRNLSNTDDDTVGVIVSAVSGSPTEGGGTATFTVSLATIPAAAVTFSVSSSDLGEGTVSPASLTFTALDWNVPSTVTVTGVDDGLVDDPQTFTIILGAAVSADPQYSGLNPADVSVTNYPVGANTAPSFTLGPDQAVPEDAPATSIVGWATDILPGTPAEAFQTVSFLLTNDNPELFAAGPAVSSAGTLEFNPAKDANGVANVTIRAKDNGGTVGGGEDESAARTFKITVVAVNDPPTAEAVAVTTPEETPRAITLKGNDPVEGSLVRYSIFAAPKRGSAKLAGAILTYTPKKDLFGTDTLLYRVYDGKSYSAPAAVTISVVNVNDIPVVVAKAVALQEDTPTVIALSATDVDGDPLVFEVVTAPIKGSLSAPGPLVTYTPNPDENGTDSFEYRVNDGTVNSAVAKVTLTIKPVNDPPVTSDENIVLNEDASAPVTLTGSDTEGATISYLVVTQPANGILSGTAPNLTYTPDANFNGADSFVFRVKDGLVFSAPATVSFTINPLDDPPAANAQSVETAEDTAVAVLLTGTELDGQALTFAIVAPPAHGSLAGAGENYTFSPDPDFDGPDSFTFTVSDGITTSAAATVSLTVTAENDAPIADAQAISLVEDTATPLTLSGSDVDGNPLTYTIVTWPANGTLAGAGQNRTYTPDANFTGVDTFEFKVKDGAIFSAQVTVTLTVTPANDAPVASNKSATTAEDTPVDIELPATDVEGSPLTFAIVAAPTKGSAAVAGSTVTYTPNLNQTGTDTFTFKANDGSTDSNVATVTVSITSVNDAPVATAQALSTNEDTPKAITLAGTDVENSALTYTIVLPPVHGALSGTPPNVTYTPFANYKGPDSFQFKVKDGVLFSVPDTVSLTIDPVDDAGPDSLATSFSLTASEDSPIEVTLIGSDVAGVDPGFFQVVGVPSNGALAGVAPDLTYTPPPDWAGMDSLTYRASMDGVTWSALATVSINVASVNDLPVAENDAVVTDEDVAVPILLVGADPIEGSPVTYRIVTPPDHGTLSGTAPVLTYTPDSNYSGPDAVVFVVKDGTTDSAPATISITVNPVNDGPTAASFGLTTPEDTPKDGTLVGTDLDGNPLSYVVLSPPSNGALSGVFPDFTYTPDGDFAGTDGFTYYVNDGSEDSDVATVTIVVTAINDAPEAFAQALVTTEDTPLPVTLTGVDTEGSALTFIIVTSPANGTLSGSAPNLTYTPDADYVGADAIEFKVKDGVLLSAAATVAITVNGVDDPPVATAQSVITAEETAKAITLGGFDAEGAVITFAVVAVPSNGALSGVAPNLTYTPDADFSGSDSFTFTATAGAVTSAPATVSITVTPVNDAPVANPQVVLVTEDTAQPITLTGSDTEGSALVFIIVSQPGRGSLSGTPPAVTYKPGLNLFGPDSFTFKVKDGALFSAPATVYLDVAPGNDIPLAKPQLVLLAEDTPKPITLVATDVDGDALSYAVATAPLNGTLSGAPPNVTYTPNPNFFGVDSFTFTAADFSLISTPATVTLRISSVNDLPVAADQAVSTAEDTAKLIVLSGSDPVEGSPLAYYLITRPTHGTLVGTGKNYSYKPLLNYVGSDSFTFRVRDGKNYSNVATVSITVTPVADVTPVATPFVIKTLEDVPADFTLMGSDAGGISPTFKIVLPPLKGRISGSGAARTYTPNVNVSGADYFTYSVSSDGVTSSLPAKVTISITPVNDPPTAFTQAITTDEDTPVDITLLAVDVEGAPLTYQVVVPPENGQLSGLGANLVYLPDPNYSGPDFFLFRARDGKVDSALTRVSITVDPVDDAGPQADAQTVSTLEDSPVDITLTGSDTGGAPASTFEVVTPPSRGVLSGVAPALTYTPDLHAVGFDSFTFRVSSDGVLFSAPATVSISVNYVDFAPVADDQAVVVVEDTLTTVTLTGSDVEGATLRYTVVTKPASGTLTGTGAVWKYKPALNYTGPDSFTFKVKDAKLESPLATVSLTVTPVNDAPAAIPQQITTFRDVPAAVTLSGTDIDGDGLTYSVVSGPTHGTLAGVPPNLTYTPDPAWMGTDFLTFEAHDGTVPSVAVGVMIRVVEPVLLPLAAGSIPGLASPPVRPWIPLLTSREVLPPPPPGDVLLGVANDPEWPGAEYHFEVYLDADRQTPVFEVIARGSALRTEVWLDDVLTDDGADDDDLQNPFNLDLLTGERYFWRVRPEKGALAGAWRESTFVYQSPSAEEAAARENTTALWSVVEKRSAPGEALSTPGAVGCAMTPGSAAGSGAPVLVLVLLAGLLRRGGRGAKRED